VALVLVISVALVVSAAIYGSANAIMNTVGAAFENPRVLDGSRVVSGDPGNFVTGEFPSAKLKLTASAEAALLSSKQVFANCDHAFRICSSPVWATGKMIWSFNGITAPSSAPCSRSWDAGSFPDDDEDVVCIDKQTDTLYYFNWTLGGH
jgi:hypothetical protein